MEKVIVLFSVPIFLLAVLLIAVFVLAHYSGDEPEKKASVKTNTPSTMESSDNVASRGS
jgi:hypothetical protein